MKMASLPIVFDTVNKEVSDEGTMMIGGGPEGNPLGEGLIERWDGLLEEDEEECLAVISLEDEEEDGGAREEGRAGAEGTAGSEEDEVGAGLSMASPAPGPSAKVPLVSISKSSKFVFSLSFHQFWSSFTLYRSYLL